MGIDVTGGGVSGGKRGDWPGHAPARRRASAPGRRLPYAGIALVILSVAACSGTGGGGAAGASASASAWFCGGLVWVGLFAAAV